MAAMFDSTAVASPTLHPTPALLPALFWINWNPRPTVNSQERHNLELDPSILRTYENKLAGRARPIYVEENKMDNTV